jgi:hypothetical protein
MSPYYCKFQDNSDDYSMIDKIQLRSEEWGSDQIWKVLWILFAATSNRVDFQFKWYVKDQCCFGFGGINVANFDIPLRSDFWQFIWCYSWFDTSSFIHSSCENSLPFIDLILLVIWNLALKFLFQILEIKELFDWQINKLMISNNQLSADLMINIIFSIPFISVIQGHDFSWLNQKRNNTHQFQFKKLA